MASPLAKPLPRPADPPRVVVTYAAEDDPATVDRVVDLFRRLLDRAGKR